MSPNCRHSLRPCINGDCLLAGNCRVCARWGPSSILFTRLRVGRVVCLRFPCITHHPGESLYPYAGVAAWWFMGLLFAVLAVRVRV
jgi:hypothetical protein